MDVAALEALLPTETNRALTLIAADAQVYVADRERTDGQTSPQGWWKPLSPVPGLGGVGEVGWGYPYAFQFTKADATKAEIQAAAREFVAYFHGSRQPEVALLGRVEVDAPIVDLNQGEGPAKSFELTVIFHAREDSVFPTS